MDQELLPNSTNLFLRPYFYANKTQDRQIDSNKVRITKKIIFPIIKSKPRDRIIRESDIQEFMQDCKKISQTIYNRSDFKKTAKLDLEVYQMCLQKIDQIGLSPEDKSITHHLLDSLKDYTLNIARILERKQELEGMPNQIDYKDFKKSLYGCILSFICIMMGILPTPTIKVDTSVLTLLINEGFNFASELDAYTDTLDILTNTNELSLLAKSESR